MRADEKVERLATELGRLLAHLYVDAAYAARRTARQRNRLRQLGIRALERVPAHERADLMRTQLPVIERACRDTLATELQDAVRELLGWDDADLAHILDATAGNPDFDFGLGGGQLNADTAYGGPTVTIKDDGISVKVGAGVVVNTSSPPSPGGLVDTVKEKVKGAIAWVEIPC